MKRILLFALLLGMYQLYAGGFKKYAGEYLYGGAGSRALGMGGAYVAVANDVTAGLWNPAGLTQAEGFQALFMHAKQFVASIQYDYLAASQKFEDGSTLGFSLVRLGVNDIKDSRDALRGETIVDGIDFSKIKYFNTSDYVFLLSFAHDYNDDLAYGLNVKLLYRDFYTESALGLGFDVGVQYKLTKNLMAGLVLRDVTSTLIAWSTGEKELITPSVRPGLSYRYVLEDIGLYFQPAVDLSVLLENREEAAQLNLGPVSMDTNWGMEIGFKNTVYLRLGYDDLERFNGGVGLAVSKLAVNYSYTNFDQELGNVHRISFHLRLGPIL